MTTSAPSQLWRAPADLMPAPGGLIVYGGYGAAADDERPLAMLLAEVPNPAGARVVSAWVAPAEAAAWFLEHRDDPDALDELRDEVLDLRAITTPEELRPACVHSASHALWALPAVLHDRMRAGWSWADVLDGDRLELLDAADEFVAHTLRMFTINREEAA